MALTSLVAVMMPAAAATMTGMPFGPPGHDGYEKNQNCRCQ